MSAACWSSTEHKTRRVRSNAQLLLGTSRRDVRLEVRINGDRINGLFHLCIYGYSLGLFHPLILTFDPNFQRDIQVGKGISPMEIAREISIAGGVGNLLVSPGETFTTISGGYRPLLFDW